PPVRTDTPHTDTHPLSRHDALPISLALRETSELRQEDLQMGGALIKLLRDLQVPLVQQWPAVETSYVTAFAMASTHHRIPAQQRSEEHTSELQSRENLVCRLLLEKK